MTDTVLPLNPPTLELIRRLAEITGPAHALTDPNLQRPYLVEWRDKYVGRSPLILRPGTVDEVSKSLRFAMKPASASCPRQAIPASSAARSRSSAATRS